MYFYVNIFFSYDPWYYANLLSKLLGLCHLVVTDYSLQYAQTLPIPDEYETWALSRVYIIILFAQ